MNITGCYSLVDDFSTLATLALQPEDRRVARVVPSSEHQLQFQPGDVLGFYVESHGDDANSNYDNGVVVLNSSNYNFSELVWFASVDIATIQPSRSGSCLYPVGTNGVLNSSIHAAPVISVSMTTYSCSPSSSTASTVTYLVHPTPTSSDNNAHDELGLSTALIIGVSVIGLFVIVILSVITVATIPC